MYKILKIGFLGGILEKYFDIAVSYASEQREYIEKFVNFMEKKKLKVYFDRNEQAHMVGKLLHEELVRIYSQENLIRVIFLSNEYIKKPYTKLEAETILAENVHDKNKMFIFKFDDITYPGLNRNMLYSSITEYPDAKEYAKLIYAAIKNLKYKTRKDIFKDINHLIFIKLKTLEKKHFGIQIDREMSQKLTHVYRISQGANMLSYLQICKDVEHEKLYIWLYKTEPMEKNGTYNGWICFENNNFSLNNRGILNTLDPVIKCNTIEDIANIIYDKIITHFGN